MNKVNGCAKLPVSDGFAHTWTHQDDGSPLLCCGRCSKWQHIACHDMADRNAGRPKRDWDAEEFICCACQGRNVPNGRQVPNGSSSASYDLGRTPSPYHHQPSGYPGQASYGQNYPLHPHLPRLPYPHHTAITFSHYQPQQRGFSSTHSSSPHAQAMSQAPTYTQPAYGTHGPPSKLSQYSTPQASAVLHFMCFSDDKRKRVANMFFFPGIVLFSCVLERRNLARPAAYHDHPDLSPRTPGRELAHASARARSADCYQLRYHDVVVVVQCEHRALLDVRCWCWCNIL